MSKTSSFAQLVLASVAGALMLVDGSKEVVTVYVLMIAAYAIEFYARLKAENEQPRTEIVVGASPDKRPCIDDFEFDPFYDPKAFEKVLRDDELPREGLG